MSDDSTSDRPSLARRYRAVGRAILAAGFACALLTYWIETRRAEPSIDDLIPGAAAADERQMDMMYGHTTAMLMEWLADLNLPAGHAVLIVVGSAVVAGVCFRLAWLEDDSGTG